MKSHTQTSIPLLQRIEIQQAIEIACNRIAPAWPLDQLIAVNPYWGFVGNSIQATAAKLECYSGSRMVMPRSFYREQWRSGAMGPEHLQEALRRSGLRISIDEAIRRLEEATLPTPRIPLMTSMADAQLDLLHGMSISAFVTHNVSQHCASYFDQFQSSWGPQHREGLYQSWLQHACTDRSPWLLMGIHDVRSFARLLPKDPRTLIETVLTALPVPEDQRSEYLTAVLMSINGWASCCAYKGWQARLSQREDDHILHLLAIRLAWEHYAFLRLLHAKELSAWKDAWKSFISWQKEAACEPSADWIFQEALEIAHQSSLCQSLTNEAAHLNSPNPPTTSVQAVFCIDVRSEIFRRALESCSENVQTLGFAGFLGLPISYTPLGTSGLRPQLPGLLAAKLHVSDTTGFEGKDREVTRRRQRELRFKSIWKDFRSAATSTFTFVESCGFFYAGALLRKTLHATAEVRDPSSEDDAALRPRLSRGREGGLISDESKCDLVAGILVNMSLTKDFARLVLLTGHGSQSANNPQEAGLNCGACGGQAGDINARVLAELLNDTAVRAGLLARGIAIPSTTYVLAALHNTATDKVTIFDTDLLPQTHVSDLRTLEHWLQQAGHLARKERAEPLGIRLQDDVTTSELLRQFHTRSCDWSQVRPEWGLANNSAFLIAPRNRSRGVNLRGRVFLQDYRSVLDPDGTVLEALMTAPMLVANWINMQYYASTVDNHLYGSGNKVLHNVVGGSLGVFEGNGGDLRIGLPLQSLHDGKTLRHIPLRLSVFIESPQNAISAVIHKHDAVKNLIDNFWLHLFQIDPESNVITRYGVHGWESAVISQVAADVT